MQNIDTFDVLIVYSQDIAISASDPTTNTPFPRGNNFSIYNDVYAYFLQQCAKYNLSAAFCSARDIVGPGKCKSYWLYTTFGWIAVTKPCRSRFIFDKLNPTSQRNIRQRNLLLGSSTINSFTNEELAYIFSDKQLTYDEFPEFSIPTITLDSQKPNSIQHKISILKNIVLNQPTPQDFSLKSFVLKDRNGYGGTNIYKITKNITPEIQSILRKHTDRQFVLQPFVKFDKGFAYKNYRGFSEIRLIYLGKKVEQTYMRVAAKNDYLCNNGSGGIPLALHEVPEKVKSFAACIVDKLPKQNALFALDFIVSNSGNVYLLEGNNTPGIDWHPESAVNVAMNKKMIRIIVKEIGRIIDRSRHSQSYESLLTRLPLENIKH